MCFSPPFLCVDLPRALNKLDERLHVTLRNLTRDIRPHKRDAELQSLCLYARREVAAFRALGIDYVYLKLSLIHI